MNIWQELAKPLFILAPMEAVTDHIFRRIVAQAAAPDLFFSEFTNATGWVHAGDKATAGRLDIHSQENYPIIAQLWGVVPGDIAKLSIHCKKLGYKAIDINMGCPDSSAIKSGGGAAMCQTPELASDIITAAKTAGLPVSVKCRLGYKALDDWRPWVEHLLRQDLSALTIHLRSKTEMSKVPARWEVMPEIIQMRNQLSPDTVIIGNGDVRDRQHGLALIQESGCDGVMIGRGVFSNIFCFDKSPKEHSKQELIDLLKLHISLYSANSGKKRPYETLKRFYKVYIRDFAGAHELRNSLMDTNSTDEALKVIAKYDDLDL